MKHYCRLWMLALISLGFFMGGCGAITASSLLKHGAMWAGKQLITKEIKKRHERQHDTNAGKRKHRKGEAPATPPSPEETGASSAPAE